MIVWYIPDNNRTGSYFYVVTNMNISNNADITSDIDIIADDR